MEKKQQQQHPIDHEHINKQISFKNPICIHRIMSLGEINGRLKKLVRTCVLKQFPNSYLSKYISSILNQSLLL